MLILQLSLKDIWIIKYEFNKNGLKDLTKTESSFKNQILKL